MIRYSTELSIVRLEAGEIAAAMGGSGVHRDRTYMADPCCCMAESNTVLESNYPSTKNE